MITADLVIRAAESALAQDGFHLRGFCVLGQRHGVCDCGCGEEKGEEEGEFGELHCWGGGFGWFAELRVLGLGFDFLDLVSW